MIEDDPLRFWRLADTLSVENAAILIAGGDPSAVDNVQSNDPGSSTMWVDVKRTVGHPNFVAVFTSLKSAVRKGHFSTQLKYRVHFRDMIDRTEPVWVLPREFLTDPTKFKVEFGDIQFGDEDNHCICIEKEPDWSSIMLDVGEIKAWLSAKGFRSGFFFPKTEAEPDDFMDPSHEHFAPELALAVAAWRALAQTQKHSRGPKASIETWISSNPAAWQGGAELSTSAKERIATVANWNRTGGATPTQG